MSHFYNNQYDFDIFLPKMKGLVNSNPIARPENKLGLLNLTGSAGHFFAGLVD